MRLDSESLTGTTFTTSRPYEVGREKIREFADAIGDPNSLYRDRDAATAAGHRDVVAPPTFAITVAFEPLQAMLDALELPLHTIMHADQRFTAHRPIHPGDRLVATLTVETVRHVAGTDLIATRTEVETADGEPVCTATAKVVHKGDA